MSAYQVFTEQRLEEFSQALIRWRERLVAKGESQLAIFSRHKIQKSSVLAWTRKTVAPTPVGLLRVYQASQDPAFIMTSNEIALAMAHPRRTQNAVPDEMHDLVTQRDKLIEEFSARLVPENGLKIDVSKKMRPTYTLERATAIANAVDEWYRPIAALPMKERGAEFARQGIPIKVVHWHIPPDARKPEYRQGAPTAEEMLLLYDQTGNLTFLLTSEEIASLQRKHSRVPEKLIMMRHLADEYQAGAFSQGSGTAAVVAPVSTGENAPAAPPPKEEKPATVSPKKAPEKKPDETVRERAPEQSSVLQMIAYALQSMQCTANQCAEMAKWLDGVPEKQRKKAAAIIRQLIKSFSLSAADFEEFVPEELTDANAETRLKAILGTAFGRGGK